MQWTQIVRELNLKVREQVRERPMKVRRKRILVRRKSNNKFGEKKKKFREDT